MNFLVTFKSVILIGQEAVGIL